MIVKADGPVVRFCDDKVSVAVHSYDGSAESAFTWQVCVIKLTHTPTIPHTPKAGFQFSSSNSNYVGFQTTGRGINCSFCLKPPLIATFCVEVASILNGKGSEVSVKSSAY